MAITALNPIIKSVDSFPVQALRFPESRYMGSKHKLLPFIYSVLKDLKFESALDAFSGSGAVAYLLKSMGKAVTANDHLHFCYHYANASVANSSARLTANDLSVLLSHNRHARKFIRNTFAGLYFTDSDNRFLDNLVANIAELPSARKRSIALAAVCRGCLKRRPRGVFTYIGDRYDDGRADLSLTLSEHFELACMAFNKSVFANGRQSVAKCRDVRDLDNGFDLVYLDPPYVSSSSDNDYTRRYHFIEGLVRYWEGVEIQQHTITKKFKALHTPFRNREEVFGGFDSVFKQFADSTIVVSYSSTGIPSRRELANIMKRYKRHVEVVCHDHSYSFGTHSHKKGNENNRVQEFLFIGT